MMTRAQFRVREVTREPAWRGVVVRGAAEQNPTWTPWRARQSETWMPLAVAGRTAW